MAAGGEYQFVAWIRSGIGALLGGPSATVSLELAAAGQVAREVTAHGPGDVTGLDPRAVIRTVPRAGARDFEPNLFPAVELEHPALPWMLSPAPDAARPDRVTPWIVLVVVEHRSGVALNIAAGGRRVLTIAAPASPADELPPLAQAWAWAHGQAVGAAGGAIDRAALSRSAGESRARLVAPRRLEPNRPYLACVVPAFAAGVAAGLGRPTAGVTGLAWTGAEPVIELPVYYAWSFATGPGGDFASLARLLRPERLGAAFGHRTVDIAQPAWGLPAVPAASIEVTAALRSPDWDLPAPTPAAAALGTAILAQLDAAAAPPAGQAPVLPLPFYGAAITRAERTADSPAWQDELNRDPSQRVAAGLGAAVVRAYQEDLVDAAWQAAVDVDRANAAVRRAELAAEITARLARRHVDALDDDGEALAIGRPLLARMHLRGDGAIGAGAVHRAPTLGTPTVAAAVRASRMPTAALSPSLRRLGRDGGPIARGRFTARTGALLEQIDAGAIAPVPPRTLGADIADFDAISAEGNRLPRFHLATEAAVDDSAAAWKAEATERRRARGRSTAAAPVALARSRIDTELPPEEIEWTPGPISTDPDPDPVQIDEFAAAARAHQRYLVTRLGSIADRPRRSLGALGVIRAQMQAQWTPARGTVPLLAARLDGVAPELIESFAPIRVAPVLERPLVGALAALSPDHVLPGVGGLAENRAALAETSPEVVRAFLVGANEELGRELLWRGFPGALGHTWLRTFWGRTIAAGTAPPIAVPDIPPIEEWPDAGPRPTPATLVLVVRADVLHRYPNAVVYAIPARWEGTRRVIAGGAPKPPVVVASLGDDVAVFGFDLLEADARGGEVPSGPAGWYFAIAEHPSEPRFGLAAAPTAGAPATWQAVAWSDLAPGDLAGNYLRADQALSVRPTGQPAWGVDAAHQAALTMRHAVRVAIHASTLLP